MARPTAKHSAAPHRIEIKLRDLNQLFNTMDPSPFNEKDLDADAEEFIVSWAREFPLHDPVVLTIHLVHCEVPQQPDAEVEQAIHHYFKYRAGIVRMEFRRLMREGRLSLLIGLVFLSICLTAAQLLARHSNETIASVGGEGLTIFGWVAMWQPLQIYLYGWWPLRRRWKILEKLGSMKVEIHH
jgi:hypothetical protein